VIALCSLAGACPAGEMLRARLGGPPLSLLNGRLLLRMPAGAQVQSIRPTGLFASSAAMEEEGIAVFESKGERMTVVVSETFTKGGIDFGRRVYNYALGDWAARHSGQVNVKVDLASGNLVPEDPNQVPILMPWSPQDPNEGARIRGLVVVPPAVEDQGDAVLICSLFLVMPDQTVLVLSIYVNSKAAQDIEACQKLAALVVGSFQPGGRRLALDSGPRQLVLYSRKNALSLTAPWNAPITLSRGRNFLAYRIRPLCDFGKPCPSLVFYYGGNANYAYKQAGPEANVVTSKGKLLDQDVEWYNWSSGKASDAMHNAEAMVANVLPDEALPMVLHVFISGPQETEVIALRKVAETLKVVPLVEAPTSAPATEPATQPATSPATGPATSPASDPATEPARIPAPSLDLP